METDWHRLFGLILIDFFTGTPFHVELEKDLSIKMQRLDVVILRRGDGPLDRRLPDGMEGLAAHNLITFKSYQEPLDDWALKELTGHYVNYRKQTSPSLQRLLPESDFRLFAVCARYPRDLAGQVAWSERQPGVYDCRRGTDVIRVLVARQLPQAEHNALLHLFSAAEEQFRYGAEHYRQHSGETSTLLHRLWEGYKREGLNMPYTMADFRRDYVKEHLKDLTPEEILERIPMEKLLEKVPLEQRLSGLAPEEILAGMTPEERARLLKLLLSDVPPPTGEPAKPGDAPQGS